MIMHPIVKKAFQNYIQLEEDIPNIILSGNSGIGKTSLATLFCKQKKILYKEFNASDDRGIEIINQIYSFYKKNGNTKCVFILDEADNITSKAQLLIVQMMELYKKKIKFIFTANNCQELIDEIHKNAINFNLENKDEKQYISFLKWELLHF